MAARSLEKRSPGVLHRQNDRATGVLLFLVLGLLAAAFVVYAYPWADLAYLAGQKATTQQPLPRRPLAETITAWCVDWAPYGEARRLSAPMRDDGALGDALAGDGIYSLRRTFSSAGLHYWRVVACDTTGISFPQQPSWLWVKHTDQELTVTFDTNLHARGAAARLLPEQFIVNAADTLPPLYVFGTVNDWKKADEQARLQQSRDGLYYLVYSVPQEGKHMATVGFTTGDGEVYGFMGDGRSNSWNMLQLETTRANEKVLFVVDTGTGRATILHAFPHFLSWLAFQDGRDILPLILTMLALALTFLALKRHELVHRPDLYAEAGCPTCGDAPLMRSPRTMRVHLARALALETGKYVCRQCVWEGTRLAGGSAAETTRGAHPPPRWLPILAPLVLLLVAGALAFNVRSEPRYSPSLPMRVDTLLS